LICEYLEVPLKEKHPDIRVGGYSSCKIDGTFRDGKWLTGPTEYFEDFLAYISAPETRAPLDFFSWHVYLGHGLLYLNKVSSFVRDMLRRYGFTETENFNTEWNTYLSQDKNERLVLMRTEMGASHCAAAMCVMQEGGFVDKAMYYDAQYGAHYGALFHFPACKPTKTYHAFRLFGEVYALRNECSVKKDSEYIYTAAAASDGEGVLMLANPEPKTSEISLHLTGIDIHSAEISILDADRDGEASPIDAASLAALTLPPHSVTLIRVK